VPGTAAPAKGPTPSPFSVTRVTTRTLNDPVRKAARAPVQHAGDDRSGGPKGALPPGRPTAGPPPYLARATAAARRALAAVTAEA
jgi:hypothetical protein